MKFLLVDSDLLQKTKLLQNGFLKNYEQFKQLCLKKMLTEKIIIDNFHKNLDELWKVIFYSDYCKQSSKVVNYSILYMKELNEHKQCLQCNRQRNPRQYFLKHIRFLQLKQRIQRQIILITIDRVQGKKEILVQSLKYLLNIVLINYSPIPKEQQYMKMLAIEAYQELIMIADVQSSSNIWSQFLRHELNQQKPNYQCLLNIVNRHFPESYIAIPLYILLKRYNHARQALHCFTVKSNRKQFIKILAKMINYAQRRDFRSLRRIYNDEIYKYKFTNLNFVIKKIFMISDYNKDEVKKQFIYEKNDY